jgi:hypothetical protein
MKQVRVNVERLALQGLDPGQRQALVDGLRTELARLLADPATRVGTAKPRRTPVLRLGNMPLATGNSGGRTVGIGIARAIARSLHP